MGQAAEVATKAPEIFTTARAHLLIAGTNA